MAAADTVVVQVSHGSLKVFGRPDAGVLFGMSASVTTAFPYRRATLYADLSWRSRATVPPGVGGRPALRDGDVAVSAEGAMDLYDRTLRSGLDRAAKQRGAGRAQGLRLDEAHERVQNERSVCEAVP